jgi:hypothetical protein
MTDQGAEERRLWQRWQALGETSLVTEPDALLLAAYAEGRLSEAEAEPVEAWLAATPDGLSDILAARSTYQHQPQDVYQRVLTTASALVSGDAQPSAKILPFRSRPARSMPQWRTALAWSSIAASLLCASLIGFSLGSDAYMNLAGTNAVDSVAADGLGATSLDSYFSDDSGT